MKATGTQSFQGSRLHMLNLSGAVDFPLQISRLLQDANIIVQSSDRWQPHGMAISNEMDLTTFASTYCPQWQQSLQTLRNWWAPYGGQLPLWDLLSTCNIDGTPGMLLVEAKAHERELSIAGKPLPETSASAGSKENHQSITNCVTQANCGLNTIMPGAALTCESHYQLVNRLAWAWKVATLGIPVVLLYLGFTGDSYFCDDYFNTGEYWQRVMGGYIQGVIPQGVVERQWTIGTDTSFSIRLRTLPVITPSARDIESSDSKVIMKVSD